MQKISISTTDTQQYFSKIGRDIAKTLSNASKQEQWHKDFAESHEKLVQSWLNRTDISMFKYLEDVPDALLTVLAGLRLNQSMLLLSEIQQHTPDIFHQVTVHSINNAESEPNRVNNDRMNALNQLNILKRIFSSERTSMVANSINKVNQKYKSEK